MEHQVVGNFDWPRHSLGSMVSPFRPTQYGGERTVQKSWTKLSVRVKRMSVHSLTIHPPDSYDTYPQNCTEVGGSDAMNESCRD
mmetsp:Transcript_46075/g.52253  ORF Transcript_46075/g.52253 Transcript_46075/m.52253 type:complete len:84 (+) Transcript_46075:256-507(+)